MDCRVISLVGGLAGCSARGGPSWIGVSFFGKQLVEDFPPRPGISTNQPTKLKSEREIVHQAVAQNGMALQYAAEELKSDKDFFLQAVAEDGRAIRFAAEELQRDRQINLAALQSPSGAMRVLDQPWYVTKDEFRPWRAELAADRSFVEAWRLP
mmetsp:Transcript_15006/g.35339  ORF Transcript_15006/g.35339 Transcript_15006/m.35339 type:complete len:154 (+) Transcript_15006:509-970(+)